MMNTFYTASPHAKQHRGTSGFTLIEILIAIVITIMVGGAIVTNYIVQQRAATKVRQVAHMQQQIRGAITVMSEDFRLAGLNRDPDDPNSFFGILNISDQAIVDEEGTPITAQDGETALQSDAITIAYDFDRFRPNIERNSLYDTAEDGTDRGPPTTMSGQLDEPFFTYRLFNEGNDSTLELAREVYLSNGNLDERQLLAENIEAIGFAYAFDNDEDGLLDRPNSQVAWAVDSTGDGRLDTNLDANGDGLINADDADPDGTNPLLGTPLSDPVGRDKIRAVRIWLLACTSPVRGHEDNNTYIVGKRVIRPQDGDAPVNRRRMVMDHIVNCRNMWPTKQM